MKDIIHPISGESGYFATEKEKRIIDVALLFLARHQKNLSLSKESELNG